MNGPAKRPAAWPYRLAAVMAVAGVAALLLGVFNLFGAISGAGAALHQVGGHGGGDIVLAHNFLELIRGEAESVAPLEAGLQSVLMCLKARESAVDHTFKAIQP